MVCVCPPLQLVWNAGGAEYTGVQPSQSVCAVPNKVAQLDQHKSAVAGVKAKEHRSMAYEAELTQVECFCYL